MPSNGKLKCTVVHCLKSLDSPEKCLNFCQRLWFTLKYRECRSVWPDWAIYWTLGNFSKLLALINLSRSPTFLGNFCKGVKIFYFFLVKSFLGNFIDIWRLFTGHTDCTQPRHKDDKLNIWNFFVHLILFKAQFTRSGFHASVWQDRNVSKHKNFHFSVNGAIWKQ